MFKLWSKCGWYLCDFLFFVFSMSFHFRFPFFPTLLTPLSLAIYLLKKPGYLFCSVSCCLDFCDYIPVVLTGVCWGFGYILLGFLFPFEFCLTFMILIRWVKLDHLLEDLEKRSTTNAMCHMWLTCDLLCLVTWFEIFSD